MVEPRNPVGRVVFVWAVFRRLQMEVALSQPPLDPPLLVVEGGWTPTWLACLIFYLVGTGTLCHIGAFYYCAKVVRHKWTQVRLPRDSPWRSWLAEDEKEESEDNAEWVEPWDMDRDLDQAWTPPINDMPDGELRLRHRDTLNNTRADTSTPEQWRSLFGQDGNSSERYTFPTALLVSGTRLTRGVFRGEDDAGGVFEDGLTTAQGSSEGIWGHGMAGDEEAQHEGQLAALRRGDEEEEEAGPSDEESFPFPPQPPDLGASSVWNPLLAGETLIEEEAKEAGLLWFLKGGSQEEERGRRGSARWEPRRGRMAASGR